MHVTECVSVHAYTTSTAGSTSPTALDLAAAAAVVIAAAVTANLTVGTEWSIPGALRSQDEAPLSEAIAGILDAGTYRQIGARPRSNETQRAHERVAQISQCSVQLAHLLQRVQN
eukprot:6199356-Pleurochrysis_carterae.AAC.9